MRKMRLELDALTVQSFAAAEGTRARRGTVRAHALTDLCETVEMCPGGYPSTDWRFICDCQPTFHPGGGC